MNLQQYKNKEKIGDITGDIELLGFISTSDREFMVCRNRDKKIYLKVRNDLEILRKHILPQSMKIFIK